MDTKPAVKTVISDIGNIFLKTEREDARVSSYLRGPDQDRCFSQFLIRMADETIHDASQAITDK